MRVEGLDKVRAMAALSVMLAHLAGPSLPGVLRYAFTGLPAVIAFFVVSGFCIHYPYRDKPLPIVAFITARFVRIGIPMLIAMALAYRAGVLGFNPADGYILWSLVCELWYYALYPAFLAASRFIPWRLQWALAMVVSYALMLSLGSDEYGNMHIYGPWLNWAVCLPAWLLGCVLADSFQARAFPVVPVRVGVALTASGLAMLGSMYLTMNFFALLVFLWVRNEVNASKASWLDNVGTWSYSIYLFHVIAATFIGKITGQPVVVIAGTLLACYIANLLVEKPAHKFSRALRSIANRPPYPDRDYPKQLP